MSSKTFRDAFEARWAIAMPALAAHDTLNDEPDRQSLPAQWATFDYTSFGEKRVSLGKPACRRESGNIIVVVFVKAGTATSALTALTDSVCTAFRDWKDSTGKISIEEVGPGETGGESDGLWFAASVNLLYNFDQYI